MSAHRPFQARFLWDKKIWDYPNSGFTDDVTFEVERLSENQILFTCDDEYDKYDEEYIITIPNEPKTIRTNVSGRKSQ